MINAERLVSRNGHPEIFSLPQITENSRQYLLLRTDIFPKTVVGCPLSVLVLSSIQFHGRVLLE